MASDLGGRSQWDPWKIDLQEGHCELQMWHRAVTPPFYPDMLFRLHVPIQTRDGGARIPDYERGEMVLLVYSYIAKMPKEYTPLHRIESVILDGKEIPRIAADSMYYPDNIFRLFKLGSSDAMGILESFTETDYLRGSINLVLTLSNGVVVEKKVRPGRVFRTQAKMLSLCMADDFIH